MATMHLNDFKQILSGEKNADKLNEMLRVKVWLKYFNNTTDKSCFCCEQSIISISRFKCSMIICETNGGHLNLNNLCPVCNDCFKLLKNKDLKNVKKSTFTFKCCSIQ